MERIEGKLKGLSIARNVKDVNHFQFVDDTLFLGSASKKIFGRFKQILDCYLDLSRGLVNKRKCLIYGQNNFEAKLLKISKTLEFIIETNFQFFKYLIIPISMGPTNSECWSVIMNKLKKKIQPWGAQWLTTAGRVILVKSVLSSFPILPCSGLLALKYVLNQMSLLIRKFCGKLERAMKRNFILCIRTLCVSLRKMAALR